MDSIIILNDSDRSATHSDLVEGLVNAKFSNIVVIGGKASTTSDRVRYISLQTNSYTAALSQAMSSAAGNNIVIINGSATLGTEGVGMILSKLKEGTCEFLFVAPEVAGESEALVVDQPDMLLRLLTESDRALAIAVGISRKNSPPSLTANSSSEILTKLLIRASVDCLLMEQVSVPATIADSANRLSDSSRASCIRELMDNANIEDIFPNHAWVSFEAESAACAYHTLAAHFIRLSDFDSAWECLGLSDKLEDSPRSLALKGIISLKRGEMLGAVANIVSSLQQYELRKKENEQHFAQFSPNDLQLISENLKAGLQALNHRDNAKALSFFSEAILEFDPFFGKVGIEIQ